jgi:hypothetical protein
MTLRTPLIALLTLVALAACAETPDPNSFGARVEREGGNTAALGKAWNAAQETVAEGRDLIASGEKQVKRGEKQIASGEDNVDDGRAKIAKGKRMITTGEARAAEAEAAYRLSRTALPTIPPAN